MIQRRAVYLSFLSDTHAHCTRIAACLSAIRRVSPKATDAAWMADLGRSPLFAISHDARRPTTSGNVINLVGLPALSCPFPPCWSRDLGCLFIAGQSRRRHDVIMIKSRDTPAVFLGSLRRSLAAHPLALAVE